MPEITPLLDPDTGLGVGGWRSVDDVVMGGVSSSQVRLVEGAETGVVLRFSGEVSLEQGGGFCSARTEAVRWDLREHDRLELRARSEHDRRYKLTLRTPETGSGSWRHPFELEAGVWRTLTLELEAFERWRRGTRLPEAGPLDLARICSAGWLISDRQAGSFQLDVAWLRAL